MTDFVGRRSLNAASASTPRSQSGSSLLSHRYPFITHSLLHSSSTGSILAKLLKTQAYTRYFAPTRAHEPMKCRQWGNVHDLGLLSAGFYSTQPTQHTHTHTHPGPLVLRFNPIYAPTPHTHTESKSQQAAARRITTEPKSKTTKTQDANAGVQVRQDPI